MLKRIVSYRQLHGTGGLLRAGMRRLMPPRAKIREEFAHLVQGKFGLEVGGPSGVFSPHGLIPVYAEVGSLDNCNFSINTEWEGSIKEGKTFKFSKRRPPGQQFVLETTDLHAIPDAQYDFFLSSHVIEHSANPIKALSEWMRVVKPDAPMLLIAPHREGTFDWKRPVTSLEHMESDYACNMLENDSTHFDEILRLHDLSRDPEIETEEQFMARVADNHRNRCVHHHVFDTKSFARLLDRMNLQILNMETAKPFHIIALVKKMLPNIRACNQPWMHETHAKLLTSVFATDRPATQRMEPSPGRNNPETLAGAA